MDDHHTRADATPAPRSEREIPDTSPNLCRYFVWRGEEWTMEGCARLIGGTFDTLELTSSRNLSFHIRQPSGAASAKEGCIQTPAPIMSLGSVILTLNAYISTSLGRTRPSAVGRHTRYSFSLCLTDFLQAIRPSSFFPA